MPPGCSAGEGDAVGEGVVTGADCLAPGDGVAEGADWGCGDAVGVGWGCGDTGLGSRFC
jgi:hypothetical protein